MSNWPLPSRYSDVEQGGSNTGDSGAVTVTCGTRTLGSWTEIIAATSFEWVSFQMHSYGGAVNGYFQLGVGTGGSEVTVGEFTLMVGGHRGVRGGIGLPIPLSISNGSRVSVRASGHTTTPTIEIGIVGIARAGIPVNPQFVTCDLIGMEKAGGSTTHGKGVAVDPGGTAHTKSAWVEIDASLAENYAGIDIQFDDGANGSQTGQDRLWDFAIGAGGSEIVIAGDIYQKCDGSENTFPSSLRIPAGFPSGTRFAARMQSSIIDATDRIGNCSIIGYR